MQPLLDRVAVENARLIRRARAELLANAGAVTIEMLADGRSATDGATRQWLNRQRDKGRLVTVEHEGRRLVPTFQLDDTFDVDPLAGDAAVRMHAIGMDGWAVWRWFYVRNTWIGRRPVDAVDEGDADAVRRALDGLIDA